MKVIYSNCTGSYVVEDEIVDSVSFGEKDAVEKCLQIEKGELLDEEKRLMKKHPKAVMIREVEDKNRINEALALFKEKSKEFFDTELKLAKRKIKESVKFDNLLINASDCVEESTRHINMLSRRLREWYGLANPELSRKTEDNLNFAKKVVENPGKEKDSMGIELNKEDFEPVKNLAQEIINLNELKEKQQKYIEKVMKRNCSNLLAVAGPNLGAKLIALAGSFKRLASMPASTIQVLGAEKALFRHVRTGAKSPKHGVIIQHPLVAGSESKGVASRQIADKISIAAKVDFFGGEFIGNKLLEGLRKKIG